MRIEESLLNCVAFIGLQKADQSFELLGTVFFIVDIKNDLPTSVYAVTAKHIIDTIRDKSLDDVFIRFNLKNGGCRWEAVQGVSKWLYHPKKENVDVAICPVVPPDGNDHLFFGVNSPTPAVENLHLGQEVFITGLFRYHFGENKNLPIVRVGNLATLDVEKLNTTDYGLMDARLIEVRSIGGLSGAPVFYHTGSEYRLLGLIHGHYDVEKSRIDEAAEDSMKKDGSVNTGIAIVVPVEKILETIRCCESSPTKSLS